jgi:hypothetical protein
VLWEELNKSDIVFCTSVYILPQLKKFAFVSGLSWYTAVSSSVLSYSFWWCIPSDW